MAKSNREIVDDALITFRDATAPWMESQMKAKWVENWEQKIVDILRENNATRSQVEDGKIPSHWDVTTIFSVINGDWPYHFRYKLDKEHRTLLNEIKSWRDDFSHQKTLTADDTYRVLDTVHRFMQAIGAGEYESKLSAAKQDLLRKKFEESKRNEKRRARTQVQLLTEPLEGLRPWREVIQPHPDVASGRFMVAEFAADLAQVYRGEGEKEYTDPFEFFRRTHLTEGLRNMLLNAFKRLMGNGGDPVLELQTNFGGGKTHSMLALYHLCGCENPATLVGIESLMQEAKITEIPSTRRAVLVGTAISPASPREKDGGIVVNTLWGEMAWQLDGKRGYDRFAKADANGGAPGTDDLTDFFKTLGPTLILIDEWVAYLRQMHETRGLPGGSFESNITFVQALTEAVKASPQVFLVASLPQSRIEMGGEGGIEALHTLEEAFKRVGSSWEPATRDESFEIVRRRLFEPLSNKAFAARDAVAQEFATMYRKEKSLYPSSASDDNYQQQLVSAYPIHPELFKRLYEDWASLERFQRSRGVLRLMAGVIHQLWMNEDKNLLIMPSTVPLEDHEVREEITRYLPNGWKSLIDSDVDGEDSEPYRLDAEIPTFAKVSAARRVARTVFLGSAPIAEAANHSVDDAQIRIGCVQPGEQAAPFVDALRKLSDRSTYMYTSNTGAWYDLQPNINRTARQLAGNYTPESVIEEIERYLREQAERGDFHAVHAAPDTTGDVPDEMETRLVILGPKHVHVRNSNDSSAMLAVDEFINKRGNQPRIYRNALVFVAPDKSRIEQLDDAVRDYLAWSQLFEEAEERNLTPHNVAQVKKKRDDSKQSFQLRLSEAWRWMLVPDQESPQETTTRWDVVTLSGSSGGQIDPVAVRAGKKLKQNGQIYTEMGGAVLKMHLDRVLMPDDKDHLCIRTLSEWFAQYHYLPRLTNSSVLSDSVSDGLKMVTWLSDSFAYADRYDEDKKRYVGLVAGSPGVLVRLDGNSVLVRSEIAKKQLDAEVPESDERPDVGGNAIDGGSTDDPKPISPQRMPTHFHGRIEIPPNRPLPQCQSIIDNVVQHLVGTHGAKVELKLIVSAEHADGFNDAVQRTVKENCSTMKFEISEFGSS